MLFYQSFSPSLYFIYHFSNNLQGRLSFFYLYLIFNVHFSYFFIELFTLSFFFGHCMQPPDLKVKIKNFCKDTKNREGNLYLSEYFILFFLSFFSLIDTICTAICIPATTIFCFSFFYMI